MPLEGPCLTWLDRKPAGIKFMALEPTDLSTACWWLPPELPRLIHALDGLLVLNPDAITDARSRYGFAGPIFVVPSTVKEAAVAASDITRPKGVVGCISRLSPEKGVDFALAAFALHAARAPGSRFRIWGDGPDRERLEQLVVMLGIGDRVSFEGAFDGFNQMDRICQACEVFILNSWTDSCPIALLEVASRGIPVVATATRGARYVLGDKYPWCIPIGDTGKMARALDDLMADAGAREAAGRELSARYQRVFDPRLAAAVLLEAYESLAGCSP
jgi:glycosyltransferase involved in cell wall biosynthesis